MDRCANEDGGGAGGHEGGVGREEELVDKVVSSYGQC